MEPVIVVTLYQAATTKLSLNLDEAKRLRHVLDELISAAERLPKNEEFKIVGTLAP